MAMWLYSYRTISSKVCLKSRSKSAKSPLPVDMRISALVPQLSFEGKLVVASQIRLFSQTKSVQEIKSGLYNKH